MEIAAQLDKAMKAAGLSIDGVSIGREDDKTTWRVDFTDGKASKADLRYAQTIIDDFNPSPDTPIIDKTDELIFLLINKGVISEQDLPDAQAKITAMVEAAKQTVTPEPPTLWDRISGLFGS